MRLHHILLITLLSLAACSRQPGTSPATPADSTGSAPVARDWQDESWFDLQPSDDPQEGMRWESAETRYSVEYLAAEPDDSLRHYVARTQVHTRSCLACETPERDIRVDLHRVSNPQGAPALRLEYDCDEIQLHADHWVAVNQGCCGAEDHFTVFAYPNLPIIQADRSYLTAEIPNTGLRLYAGFFVDQHDSTMYGHMDIGWGPEQRYRIHFPATVFESRFCPPFAPELSLQTRDARDTWDASQHHWTLWSQERITEPAGANGFHLQLDFDCDGGDAPASISIPIINGMPWGDSAAEVVWMPRTVLGR